MLLCLQTILSIAAERGTSEAVRALVDAKANVNAAGADGIVGVACAVSCSSVALYARGPVWLWCLAQTALCLAVHKNNAGTLRVLLEAKADVNQAANQNSVR